MDKYSINKFLKSNSPTILTVVGSVGVGLTAIMAARDTVKAMKRMELARKVKLRPLYTKEKIKVAAPCYIPTVLTGASTILCICGANKLNRNIQQSLTSAYVLLDQSYKEYRKTVKDVYGEEGDRRIIEDIADRKSEDLHLAEQEDDIFFDFFDMQFFNSKISKIREAEKEANEILKTNGYISLRTLYSLMGKDIMETDELLGWSTAAGKLYGYDGIRFVIDESESKDGFKYYVLDFADTPTEDYLYL